MEDWVEQYDRHYFDLEKAKKEEEERMEAHRAQAGGRGPTHKRAGVEARIAPAEFGDGHFVEWLDHDKARVARRYVADLEEANDLRASLPEGPPAEDEDWLELDEDGYAESFTPLP